MELKNSFNLASWVIAAIGFFSALTASLIVLGAMPHMVDEVVYAFQAKTLATGRLLLPGGLPGVNDYYFVYSDGNVRWGKYPPGWPLILSLGFLLRLPYLVNPLLHALNLRLIYLAGRKLYDERIALVAAGLGVLSPYMLFMGANLMPHTLELFLVLSIAYGGFMYHETCRRRYVLLSGFMWGYLAATRLSTGFLFGTVLWIFFYMVNAGFTSVFRRKNSDLALGFAAMLLPVILMFFYNQALTGNGLTPPYDAYTAHAYPKNPGCDSLGFGPDKGCGFGGGWTSGGVVVEGHSPHTAWLNLLLNLKHLNEELFGWPFTSFAFIILFVYLGGLRRPDYGLLILFGMIVFGVSLYWPTGIGYGARYYYVGSAVLLFLTARGIFRLNDWLKKSALPGLIVFSSVKKERALQSHWLVIALLALLSLWSLIHTLPTLLVYYGDNYESSASKVDEGVYRNLQALNAANSVIVVPDPYWGSGFLQNDLDMNGSVLMVKEGGFNESKEKVLAAYPGRSFYYYQHMENGYLLVPVV